MRSSTSSSNGRDEQSRTPSGKRFWRYGPLILWAALIFVGSGNVLSAGHTSILLRGVRSLFPSASDETLALVHLLVRKAGHFTEYAIFAILASRAFKTSSRDFLFRHWFWVSLLVAIAYSLSDELHQSFVPSRTGSIHDSLIDSVGALIGLALVWWRGRRNRKETAGNLRAGVTT